MPPIIGLLLACIESWLMYGLGRLHGREAENARMADAIAALGAAGASLAAERERAARADERERIAAMLDAYADRHYIAQSCAAAVRGIDGGQG